MGQKHLLSVKAAAGIYLTDWKDNHAQAPWEESLRDPRGKLIFKYKPAGNGPFFPTNKEKQLFIHLLTL